MWAEFIPTFILNDINFQNNPKMKIFTKISKLLTRIKSGTLQNYLMVLEFFHAVIYIQPLLKKGNSRKHIRETASGKKL